MTEAEWLATDDPEWMIQFVQSKRISRRKLRLFIVACCYRIRHLLIDERSIRAVKVAEQYADGVGSSRELSAAFAAAWEVVRTSAAPKTGAGAAATACRDDDVLFDNAYWSSFVHEKWPEYFHCDLLRDIFGPLPFRPITADPRWLTSTAVSLATGIYQDRAFDRLPILADALEEAGCGNEDILTHLRSDGPHVRGCWAIDLVLGKE